MNRFGSWRQRTCFCCPLYYKFGQWEDMITQQNVLKKSAYAASGVNLVIYVLNAVLYQRGNTSIR